MRIDSRTEKKRKNRIAGENEKARRRCRERERKRDSDAANGERTRLRRRYNGPRDRGLITHKSQSNYGRALPSAGRRARGPRAISLSRLFPLSPYPAKKSPLRPITDSAPLIPHLITRKSVRELSHCFGSISLNPLGLAANFLMSRADKGAQRR